MDENHCRPFDDGWRSWIAENLYCDSDYASIVETLVKHGFDRETAKMELSSAINSPYVKGASRLKNRLEKRTWPLDIYRKLLRLDPKTQQIARRSQLSGHDFFAEYYTRNLPVVISGMMDNWRALRRWNFDYFRDRFGDRVVEVQMGRDKDVNYEVNQPRLKREMLFREYVDLVEHAGTTNDFYMTANNSSRNQSALHELWDDIIQFPEYLQFKQVTDGFFWFGPRGTLTPFHHDLTNNFMAQVIGRKRVLLIPAVELPNMYNDLHCYTPVDGKAIDFERFPKMRNVQIHEVTINPGELLFLPVGCWHFVESLDVSVTMSFTNFRWDNDFASSYTTFNSV